MLKEDGRKDFQNLQRDHTFKTSAWKEGLEICHAFADSISFKQ